ncbi:unnamed protein product [Nyctereutes procyonoides]|uniref:(raccoon dog) hypothetical protein n=1 Tax=Nyctereutes procyonoides TaxID=34880 RepID=A0A811YWT5_NYCPR|nr:unnamed protein product [Nyctereutes procyonoides]
MIPGSWDLAPSFAPCPPGSLLLPLPLPSTHALSHTLCLKYIKSFKKDMIYQPDANTYREISNINKNVSCWPMINTTWNFPDHKRALPWAEGSAKLLSYPGCPANSKINDKKALWGTAKPNNMGYTKDGKVNQKALLCWEQKNHTCDTSCNSIRSLAHSGTQWLCGTYLWPWLTPGWIEHCTLGYPWWMWSVFHLYDNLLTIFMPKMGIENRIRHVEGLMNNTRQAFNDTILGFSLLTSEQIWMVMVEKNFLLVIIIIMLGALFCSRGYNFCIFCITIFDKLAEWVLSRKHPSPMMKSHAHL